MGLTLLVLTGAGCSGTVTPLDRTLLVPPTDFALLVLDQVDGGCRWSRVEATTGERWTVHQFREPCGAVASLGVSDDARSLLFALQDPHSLQVHLYRADLTEARLERLPDPLLPRIRTPGLGVEARFDDQGGTVLIGEWDWIPTGFLERLLARLGPRRPCRPNEAVELKLEGERWSTVRHEVAPNCTARAYFTLLPAGTHLTGNAVLRPSPALVTNPDREQRLNAFCHSSSSFWRIRAVGEAWVAWDEEPIHGTGCTLLAGSDGTPARLLGYYRYPDVTTRGSLVLVEADHAGRLFAPSGGLVYQTGFIEEAYFWPRPIEVLRELEDLEYRRHDAGW